MGKKHGMPFTVGPRGTDWIMSECSYMLTKTGKHFLLYFIFKVTFHIFCWPAFTKTSVYKSLSYQDCVGKFDMCMRFWESAIFFQALCLTLLAFISLILFCKLVITAGIRLIPLWIWNLFITRHSLSLIYLGLFLFSSSLMCLSLWVPWFCTNTLGWWHYAFVV
jgi:hypothetical protein